MAGLTPAEVAQLYNGIYSPAELGPAPIAPMSIEEMYRGIYGPANAQAPAPAPNYPVKGQTPSPNRLPPTPTDPTYSVYDGIFGPANLSSEPGTMPNYGQLASMFPGSSQTKTQQVIAAPANPMGFQSDYIKQDNERLLGSTFGGAAPPRAGVPVPQPSRVVASYPTAGMPRPRPAHETIFSSPAAPSGGGSLASMFTPPPTQAIGRPAGGGLRITVSGANAIPYPAPASQRPAAPRAAVAPAPAPAPVFAPVSGPGERYDVTGADMSLQPRSIQTSTRWNTGY